MAKKIEVILELDTRDFDSGVRKVNAGINKVENSAKGISNTLKGLGAALAGGFAVKGIVDATLKMEEFRTTLTAYLGDQEAANEAIANLSALANKLPQDLDDVTQAFIILKRNGVDTANESIEAFAKVAAGNGKSMEQLAEAVADSLTGEFERLKEFGVKVSKENDQFVMRMADGSQKIVDSTSEVIEVLRAQGEEGGKFAGVVAGPLSQAFSNLRGITLEVSAAFGDGLAPALADASTGIKEALAANKEMIASIGELVGNALALLLETLDLVIAAIGGFAAAWAAVKLGGIITSIRTMVTTFGTLNAVMAANPIGAVATAVGLLVAGFIHLVQETGSVSNAFKTMGNYGIEMVNMLIGAFNGLTTVISGVGIVIKDAIVAAFTGQDISETAAATWERVLADAQDKFTSEAIKFRFDIDQPSKDAAIETLNVVKEAADEVQATQEALVETSAEELQVKNELLESEKQRLEVLADIEKTLASDRERITLTQQLHEENDKLMAQLIERHENAMDFNDKESEADINLHKQKINLAEQGNKIMSDLNNKAMSSMEDAFVNFVSTGKMSFKDLIDDMLEQLKRLLAKKIFSTILNFLGGGLGGIFAGFFDQGGVIPAGKFGIVGEKGPEIVTGPAKVIGRTETERMLADAGNNGGGTNITYNISAVDAQSFKELVASDPEFIFNVTQAGARLQPI